MLQHAETPGLGAKLTEASFRDQLLGMRPGTAGLAVVKDGGRVDAITAATISSRAFVEAVNRAWQAVEAARGSTPGNADAGDDEVNDGVNDDVTDDVTDGVNDGVTDDVTDDKAMRENLS